MTNDSMPTASVILAAWNRKTEVILTLAELCKLQKDVEIIVVDNGSSDGTSEAVKEQFPRARLIPLASNIGMPAYNIGAGYARAPILVMVDDDSTVSENVVEVSKEWFDKSPEVGVIAFEVVVPSTSEVVTRDLRGEIVEFWGCGFAIRRDVWRELDGFDNDFFLYVNEHDLAIRAWDRGYRVIMEPRIRTFHRISSANRISGRFIEYSIMNNVQLVLKDIPRKYWLRCLIPMLITWAVRAILTRQFGSLLSGCSRTLVNLRHFLMKYEPVRDEVAKIYIERYKLYEWPWTKMVRKSKEGFHWLKPSYR